MLLILVLLLLGYCYYCYYCYYYYCYGVRKNGVLYVSSILHTQICRTTVYPRARNLMSIYLRHHSQTDEYQFPANCPSTVECSLSRIIMSCTHGKTSDESQFPTASYKQGICESFFVFPGKVPRIRSIKNKSDRLLINVINILITNCWSRLAR